MTSFDPGNPPEVLVPATPAERSLAAREKSAVREAIFEVCKESLGERGGRLQVLLDRIEEEDGPRAAFDSLMKLMEFAVPKLQKVTVEDPDGNAVHMPVINVTFAQPAQRPEPVHLEAEVVDHDAANWEAAHQEPMVQEAE